MSGKYYHTKESVAEYIHLAKDVNGEALIAKLQQVLPQGSTVLEIGSGPGTDWKSLNQHYQVTGSDNSAEFIKHLRAKYPKGTFLLLDATTLKIDSTFQGIYANKVLHHLTDAALEASIKRQHALLEPCGVICHSFWKGTGTEIFKGLFVNYHNEVSLEKAFNPYFEVDTIKSYSEFEKDDSLLLIGKSK